MEVTITLPDELVKRAAAAGLLTDESVIKILESELIEDNKVKAKRLPQPELISQELASVSSRPFRICFIVNRNVDRQIFQQIVQYNTSVWGGKYNLYIPSDGESILSNWWHILIEYDPDYIIYVGEFNSELQTRVFNSIQPLEHLAWNEERVKQFIEHDINPVSGVPVHTLMKYQFDRKGVVDPTASQVVYPIIRNSPYEDIFHTVFGSYLNPRHIEIYRYVYNSRDIICDPENFQQYMILFNELMRKYYPYRLTYEHINRTLVNFHAHFGVGLIVTDGKIDDLCLYHMLAWAEESAFTGGDLLIVPISDIEIEENQKILMEWYSSQKVKSNSITLFSASVDINRLKTLRDLFRTTLQTLFNAIDIQVCNFPLPYMDCVAKEQSPQITIKGERLICGVSPLDFAASLSKSHSWITEINLASRPKSGLGYIPHRFPELRYSLSGLNLDFRYHFSRSSAKIRISRQKVASTTSTKNQILSLFLPSASKLFEDSFRSHNYTTELDEKGKYYHGMIKLAKGLEGLEFMRSSQFSKLFADKDLLDGKALEIGKQLPQKAKPGDNLDTFYESIQILVQKQILLRCYNLRCPECDYETWYNISDFSEVMTCKGCRSSFQPLVRMEFSYRLNELFIRGIRQGAKTVLLTALLLKTMSEKSFLFDMGYKVGIERTDIDLIAVCDGHLVLVECKDSYWSHTQSSTEYVHMSGLSKEVEQLKRGFAIAKTLHAPFYIVATMDTEIPPEIITLIDEFDREEPELKILIVTMEDLRRGFIKGKERDMASLDELRKYPPIEDNCSEKDPEADDDRVSWF